MNVINHQEDSSTGKLVKQKSTNGAAHANIRDTSGAAVDMTHPARAALHDDIYGDAVTKVALVAGSGKGPDTFIVDVTDFGQIFLGAIMETGTVTHTAGISWSSDGVAANVFADSDAWTAQAGNQIAVLTKKGNFLHLTFTEVTGTAETVWLYVEGREQA